MVSCRFPFPRVTATCLSCRPRIKWMHARSHVGGYGHRGRGRRTQSPRALASPRYTRTRSLPARPALQRRGATPANQRDPGPVACRISSGKPVQFLTAATHALLIWTGDVRSAACSWPPAGALHCKLPEADAQTEQKAPTSTFPGEAKHVARAREGSYSLQAVGAAAVRHKYVTCVRISIPFPAVADQVA